MKLATTVIEALTWPPFMNTDDRLSILVIDENEIRASILKDGLIDAGYRRITVLGQTPDLLRKIVDADPDVIFIDLENPNRDILEQMFMVSRTVRRPIAMFVDQADTASIEAAIDAGVSAYVVDGLRKERMKPILDMTISRFNAFARLQAELDATKQKLEDRKIIEKAKGILMKTRGLTEEDAYALLRKNAMEQEIKISELARSLVTASGLLD